MIGNVLKKVFGSKNERELKKFKPIVEQINALEPEIQTLSDDQLRAKTQAFKERIDQGATLDELLPEAFAVVREASVRTLNMRHFDVQLIGGIVLHQGKIAEMKTGEGKTLAATLSAYLNALTIILYSNFKFLTIDRCRYLNCSHRLFFNFFTIFRHLNTMGN